jgi:uncharacterized protein
MIANDSKHVVLAAWRTLATRDPQRIAPMFTEDAEWLAPNGNATALALNGPSRIVGREQIAQTFGSEVWKLFTADVKVEFRGVYAEGDIVIVEQRMRATLANGNAYDNDYCFVFEVENGLIRRVREYMDTAKRLSHDILNRTIGDIPLTGRSGPRCHDQSRAAGADSWAGTLMSAFAAWWDRAARAYKLKCIKQARSGRTAPRHDDAEPFDTGEIVRQRQRIRASGDK